MSTLIIPENINDLSRWDQVFFFHRHGDTVLPLHPPSKGKNGKNPIGSKEIKRLSDFDLFRKFGNGASYNVGIIPREGDIIVNLNGNDRNHVDSFLSGNATLASVPRVQTAHGYHLRLRCEDLPSNVQQASHLAQSDITPGVSFELITGTHYVVAPPSVHEGGIPYKWVVMGEVPTWSWEQIATVFNLPPQQVPVENDSRENGQRDNIGGVGGLLGLPMPDGKEILNLTFAGNSPEIARQVFKRLAKEETYFVQGGKLVQYNSKSTATRLTIVSPDQLRSHLDKFFHPFKRTKDGPSPATATTDDAKLLLGSEEMQECLKHIARVVKHPLLVSDNGKPDILTTGAHNGVFVDSNDVIPNVSLSEAVPAILELFRDFKFNTPNDLSRGIAHLLCPALVFGNLLSGRVPMHVVQADQPGSGKGFLQKLIITIYNESPGIITNITKGVGGIDEILSRRLMSGLPFIQYDNWRGKLASEMLESALTEDTASCRALHADAIVSTKGAFFMLTSNGAELTPDLADRCSFIRITKQPDGYRWHRYGGEELSEHVKNQRVHYLGCVYSVLSEWIRRGNPQTEGVHHRFWQWAGSMDWIVQNLFGLPPLLDGHRQVQKEVASAILVFLRQIAIKVQKEDRLGEEFTAFTLVELAQRHDLSVPGVKDNSDGTAHKSLGRQLGPCFGEQDTLTLDGFFQLVRRSKKVKRDDGNGHFDTKVYIFFGTTVDPDASGGPFNCGGPKNNCGNRKPGPSMSDSDKKQPTTVDTTVEPQLIQKPTSTVVHQSPQHQGVTEQNTTGPQLTQLNTSVFPGCGGIAGGGDENSTGGENSAHINCGYCGSDDASSWLVSEPTGKTAFTLIRKKSELSRIAETLSGISEPLAIDLKTYKKRHPGGPDLMFDDEVRLLSIKAPGLPPWLIDLKEIGYDLGVSLRETLQNREIISYDAAAVVKVLRFKCGLDLNSVWCTNTAQHVLRDEKCKSGSSKIPAWEQYLLLNPAPKDPGTHTNKHGDLRRETYWRDEITEEQYKYAAAAVEYLHPLKTLLGEAMANSPMLHVFHYLNSKIPLRPGGTSFVAKPFKE
jgi:hypothetical protein